MKPEENINFTFPPDARVNIHGIQAKGDERRPLDRGMENNDSYGNAEDPRTGIRLKSVDSSSILHVH